jgi:K+-transporting ATPase ATPase C chain
MSLLIASLRLVAATMLICVAGYTAVILAVAQSFPDTAAGHLILGADGKVLGSRQIAQAFTQPRYFWPRPSSAGKNGSSRPPRAAASIRTSASTRRYTRRHASPRPGRFP